MIIKAPDWKCKKVAIKVFLFEFKNSNQNYHVKFSNLKTVF